MEGFETMEGIQELTTAVSPETVRVHNTRHKVTTAASKSLVIRGEEIPQVPRWAIGLFAGVVAFGLVFAAFLALVNFRSHLSWLGGLNRRRYQSYSKVEEDDYEESSGSGRVDRENQFPKDDGVEDHTTCRARNESARKRKRDLTIDISTKFKGLGIAFPGYVEKEATAIVRPRRPSFDEEKLRYREHAPMSPARWAWEALTAPLPSVIGFTGAPDRRCNAIELRKKLNDDIGHELPANERSKSFGGQAGLIEDQNHGRQRRQRSRYDVLERFDRAIERTAGMLAQMIDGKVTSDSEAGLLLPVRDSEREKTDH